MKYKISLKKITNANDFHSLLAKKLLFPEYYGKNLDALHDILTERTEETIIIFTGYQNLLNAEPDFFEAIKTVFEDACAENKAIFVVWKKSCFFAGRNKRKLAD